MINLASKKIFIMVGFPGSGKSILGKKLATHLGAGYLSTDIIRQELFNSSRFDNAGHDFVQSITTQVYATLYERALALAIENKKVIVDGTHLYFSKRKKMLKTLVEQINPQEVCFIVVKTPFKTIEQRIVNFSKTQPQPRKGEETFFEAWQRVYFDFKKDQKLGLISWPQKNCGVDIISNREIEKQFLFRSLFNK